MIIKLNKVEEDLRKANEKHAKEMETVRTSAAELEVKLAQMEKAKFNAEEALKSATEYTSEANAEVLGQIKDMHDKVLKCAPETFKNTLAQVLVLN